MTDMGAGRHLSDGELVQYVDAEAPEPQLRSWSEHLGSCEACADSVATLASQSDRLTEWLDAAAFEDDLEPAASPDPTEENRAVAPIRTRAVRARRSAAGPWLRAAAILVVVAAPLAALPGVRGWIAERVIGPGDDAVSADQAVAEPTVIRFLPDPGDFEVRFEDGSVGRIALERAEGDEAVLWVAGGDAEAVVSASGLRIQNAGAGEYELRLPDLTTGVWIRVGDRAVAVTGQQLDRRAVVDLATL